MYLVFIYWVKIHLDGLGNLIGFILQMKYILQLLYKKTLKDINKMLSDDVRIPKTFRVRWLTFRTVKYGLNTSKNNSKYAAE